MRFRTSNSFASASAASLCCMISLFLTETRTTPPPIGWSGYWIFSLTASWLFFYLISCIAVPFVNWITQLLTGYKAFAVYFVAGSALGFVLSYLVAHISGVKNGFPYDFSTDIEDQKFVLFCTATGAIAATAAWKTRRI